MKVLFICSQNRMRSPTAEAVFSTYPNAEVMSAGTNEDAETPIDAESVEWAEIIFVMEQVHLNRLKEKFGKVMQGKRVVVLGIPDCYDYMDPELVRILKAKVTRFLPSAGDEEELKPAR